MSILCNTFRQEAGRIWRQMGECRNLGLGLSEETLTETSLYGIARHHQASELAVFPATKPQESKHGADWEWWFTKDGRGIGFRVQAKRLFASGRYESLFKGSKSLAQLNKLVEQARIDRCIPIYIFFNFDYRPNKFGGYLCSCQHSYRGPSFWGCTIALPEDVEFANSDHIADLRSTMVPWHCLICDWRKSDLPSTARSSVARLAAPKLVGRDMRLRPRAELHVEIGSVPDYVERLIELGRTRLEVGWKREYTDHEYWTDPAVREREIAGIVTFDDQRDLYDSDQSSVKA